MQVKDQKAENENSTGNPHVNVISNVSPQNYEFMNEKLELTQEIVDTEIKEISNSDSEEEIQILDLCKCEIIDEIDFRELEQIPQVTVKLNEGQVLEEFMLEKDIEFQERDKCKIVELPDKQEIDREMTVLSKMPVETSCEQEECAEMKTCDMSLPKLFKAKESVHTNEMGLEMPKINEVGVRELPREIKLEKPTEQDKSNLHTKQKAVLGSEVIKSANPTKLVKREVCRPPPKPPDRPNGVNYEQEAKKRRRKLHENQEERQDIQNAEEEEIDAQKIDKELNCRPPPKPPYILNTKGEVIEIIENVVPKTRPPPKPPRIHSKVDREGIDQEKECLLDTVLNHRPPPKPPPKSL